MRNRDRIIIALDVDSAEEARAIVDSLGAAASRYKVGLQLLTAEGPSFVRELVGAGKEVFLDLKLFEIPASVAAAVHAAGRLGVSMVTVHASGGPAILRAAVCAARQFPNLRVMALTVVTSLEAADLHAVGIPSTVDDQVVRLGRLADQAGCHGLIAAPRELALLRSAVRADMLIYTPGVALAKERDMEQARCASPREAIEMGASAIIIGRAISEARDYRSTFNAVCADMDAAL